MSSIPRRDPEVAALVERERSRQERTLQLIPSQTLVDEAILAAQGSMLTNLTVEGQAGRRYFPGCEPAGEERYWPSSGPRPCSARSTPTSSRTRA